MNFSENKICNSSVMNYVVRINGGGHKVLGKRVRRGGGVG